MSKDYKEKVSKLNERLELLDRKFNLYFTGQDRIPPIQEFEKLKREILLLSRERDRVTSSGIRFYFNNFLQRFGSYRTKWEKALTAIEEGRSRPGTTFFSGRAKPPPPKEPDRNRKNSSHLDKEIDRAVKKYTRLYEKHLGKKCQPESVRQQLQKKIVGLKNKASTDIKLDVAFDGKEVVVKPVKNKGKAS